MDFASEWTLKPLKAGHLCWPRASLQLQVRRINFRERDIPSSLFTHSSSNDVWAGCCQIKRPGVEGSYLQEGGHIVGQWNLQGQILMHASRQSWRSASVATKMSLLMEGKIASRCLCVWREGGGEAEGGRSRGVARCLDSLKAIIYATETEEGRCVCVGAEIRTSCCVFFWYGCEICLLSPAYRWRLVDLHCMACIVQMHVAPGFRAVDTSGQLVVPDGNMGGILEDDACLVVTAFCQGGFAGEAVRVFLGLQLTHASSEWMKPAWLGLHSYPSLGILGIYLKRVL